MIYNDRHIQARKVMMRKKKGNILAWVIAGIAIISVIILIVAAIYSIVNMKIISNECSNAAPKPYFITAVSIASVAIGLQIVSIVLFVVRKVCHAISKKNQERSATV